MSLRPSSDVFCFHSITRRRSKKTSTNILFVNKPLYTSPFPTTSHPYAQCQAPGFLFLCYVSSIALFHRSFHYVCFPRKTLTTPIPPRILPQPHPRCRPRWPRRSTCILPAQDYSLIEDLILGADGLTHDPAVQSRTSRTNTLTPLSTSRNLIPHVAVLPPSVRVCCDPSCSTEGMTSFVSRIFRRPAAYAISIHRMRRTCQPQTLPKPSPPSPR